MKFKLLTGMLSAVLMISGCGGGGGDPGTSIYDQGKDTSSGGTTNTTTATASSLLLRLDQTSVKNSSSTPVVATATVVDKNGQAVEGVAVSFQVTNGVYSLVDGSKSGSDGVVKANVDFSNDKTNRVVTVKATSGSLSETRTFIVTGVKVATTPTPAIVAPGESGSIEVVVTDNNSQPIPGLAISTTAPFASSSGSIDDNGRYVYQYTVPSAFTDSTFNVQIAVGGVTQTQTVLVQQASGGTTIPDATGTINNALVEVTPSVVETNQAGSTANQVTVRAKIYDASSQPMQNVRVAFDLNKDPNSIGGQFSSAGKLVYTDANGIATTTYIPGTKATGTDALQIRACYSKSDFTPSSAGTATTGTASCPAAAIGSMTINNEALNVAIGVDDKISVTDDGLRYIVKFPVQVSNASGQPKANVLITPTLDLTGFEKGYWGYDTTSGEWGQVLTLPSTTVYADRDVGTQTYKGCRNEDVDRNGVNGGASEDVDQDNVLEPRKADAVISIIDGATKTDETGAIGLQVTFFKNVASWARIKIYVKAAVSGTEGVGSTTMVLPFPTDLLKKESTPAFADNPYGRGTSCNVH